MLLPLVLLLPLIFQEMVRWHCWVPYLLGKILILFIYPNLSVLNQRRDLLFILDFPRSSALKNNCLYDIKDFFSHGLYLLVIESLLHSVFLCSMLRFRGGVVVQEYKLNSGNPLGKPFQAAFGHLSICVCVHIYVYAYKRSNNSSWLQLSFFK